MDDGVEVCARGYNRSTAMPTARNRRQRIEAKLTSTDLETWRNLQIMDEAIDKAPEHFSREEILDHLKRYHRFCACVYQKYDLDPDTMYLFSTFTGAVTEA